MDPLSALSLAGVIVQFIDVGFKIFHEAKEIALVGSTISTRDLKIIANDIAHTAKSIDSHLSNVSNHGRAFCPEEQVPIL